MRRLVVAITVGAVMLAVAAPVAGAGGDDATGGKGGAAEHVRIVNLNLLHGAFCDDKAGCQAPDRVALLMQQLETAKCPEVVGLQEINANLAGLLEKAVPKICDGKYSIVFGGKPKSLDTERVITTLPVKSTRVDKLVGGFRTASRVVLGSPIGPIVLVVTHQDGDPEGRPVGPPCKNCPPPCKEKQSDIFACQTVAAAASADATGGAKATRVLMGDFNVTPVSARYQSLVADGWVDTYVEAGNPECDPATAEGCSSGRDDKSIASLKDPTKRQVERIDFIFVKPSKSCDVAVDTPGDADGDGVGTGLWNNEPAVDGPGGLAWTSDHTGVSADISCK
jgi:hypothetical protein